MNKLILIGHVGGEPEIRLTKGSDPICNFRVAINEWISPEKEHTEWFSVVTFGKAAINCSKRVTKGTRLYIEGRLRSEQFTDQSGANRTIIKVYASTVTFLDPQKEQGDYSKPSLEITGSVE